MSHKFKVGDKVKMLKSVMDLEKGGVYEIKDTVGYREYSVYTLNKDDFWYVGESNIEALSVVKTWDTLEVGDELMDEGGDIRTVLGVCGRVLHMSIINNKDTLAFTIVKETLMEKGYRIKQDSVEEEVIEMTVADVEKLTGYKVKIVK